MQMASSQVLDLVVLGILAVSIIIGAIRGLFKSILNIAIVVVSFFASKLISSWCATIVTDFVYPKLSGKLTGFVSGKIGFDVSLLDAEKMEIAIKSVLLPIVRYIIWIIIGIVIFIIFSLIGKMISKLIEDSDIAKKTNRILGAVLGLLTSLVVCFLIVFGVNKFGLMEATKAKFPDSIALNTLSHLLPENSEKIAINLPGMGEISLDPGQIDFDKLFKDLPLEKYEALTKEELQELLDKAKK